MDLLHSWGVELAVHLQTTYSSYGGVFHLASSVADLHTTFFWLFPVWFHLRRDTGLRLIWVAVIGDWLNLVLKWVLFGERPYWWVHETRFYGADPVPFLQQFPITCETGPDLQHPKTSKESMSTDTGTLKQTENKKSLLNESFEGFFYMKAWVGLNGSPSGHAMAAAGVWYVMVTALLSMATEQRCPPLLYKFLQMGLWGLMGLVALLVCTSRVYMAAHFPHQVIAGVITGVLVAAVVSKEKWIYSASMNKYLLSTVFLTSFAVGFYLLLKAQGVDLLWTLVKAHKWCVRPEWVHMDSTPFASLLRNMGSLLGLGLGLHSPLPSDRRNRSAASKAGCVIISLLLLQLLDGWTFSSENHLTFYFLSFGKSAVALLIPTTVVPSALSWFFKGKKEERNF